MARNAAEHDAQPWQVSADSRAQHVPRILVLQQLSTQVFLTPEYLAISMEYAKGGDMFQYVKAKGGLQVRQATRR